MKEIYSANRVFFMTKSYGQVLPTSNVANIISTTPNALLEVSWTADLCFYGTLAAAGLIMQMVQLLLVVQEW